MPCLQGWQQPGIAVLSTLFFFPRLLMPLDIHF